MTFNNYDVRYNQRMKYYQNKEKKKFNYFNSNDFSRYKYDNQIYVEI